jgi:hypothetical protein
LGEDVDKKRLVLKFVLHVGHLARPNTIQKLSVDVEPIVQELQKSCRFNAYILQVASVNTPSLIDMINFLIAEREAAFNLLSAYNSSENIEAKTPKEKQRVRISLQVLERYVLRFTRELCLYAYVRGCLHCISRDNSL